VEALPQALVAASCNVQNITPGSKGEIISRNVISEDKAELALQNKDNTINKNNLNK